MRLQVLGRAAVPTIVAVALLAAPSSAAASDLEDLRQERRHLEADLDAITAELEAVGVRFADARRQRDRLRHELDDLRIRAAAAETLLAERAASAYVTSAVQPLGLVLASHGTRDVLSRTRMLEGIGRSERGTIERAGAARLAYRQRRERIDTLTGELARDERRLAALQAELDDAFRDVRAREIALASRRDRQRPVSRRGQQGTYACPLGPPLHFRDTWGDPRSGGRRHRGVDVFAPMGAQVYAITDGVVVRHSHSRLGGIGLYILGDDRNQYYYAHLQEILPGYEPGTRVEAGELVARNGATGNADVDAPHVHLEVRPGGAANVNPYPFVAAACWG